MQLRQQRKKAPTRPDQFISEERQFAAPSDGDTIAIFSTSLGEVRAVLYPDAAPWRCIILGAGPQRLLRRHHHLAQPVRLCGAGRRRHRHRHRRLHDLEQQPLPAGGRRLAEALRRALCAAFAQGGDVTGGNSQFYFVAALPDSVSSDQQAELAQNGYTDSQVAAYAAVGGLPYLDNTDTVFGQVYQGMDVVDAMACVETTKDEDGNDTWKPTEDAAITIEKVTITLIRPRGRGTKPSATAASGDGRLPTPYYM